MDRMSDNLAGWALAATGALLAIAAVVSVILLSAPNSAAGARSAPNPAAGAGPDAGTGAVRLSHPHAARAGLEISARRTSVGTILVGPGGEVLYAFSRDTRNRDACARMGSCLAVWPPLTVDGRLRAGHGVRGGRLSTITVHGHRQVTYAGHPLYLFAEEPHGTSTDYVGVSESGGTWPAVSPSGALVH